MRKSIIFLAFIFMFLGMASALTFDNVISQPSQLQRGFQVGSDLVAYNPLWEKYAPVEVDNAFGLPEWLGGGALFQGAITEHTDTCSGDCYSIFQADISQDSALVDAVKFYTLNLDQDGNEISRNEQSIRSYQFYIENGTHDIEVPEYTDECSDSIAQNGSTVKTCNQVQIGSHTNTITDWTPYNVGDIMPSGSYTVKLEGNKRPDRTVDWIITTQGQDLTQWATWGANLNNLSTSLKKYYKFDEGTGTSTQNAVNNSNFTIGNSWTTGIINSGWKGNGVAYNPGFNLSGYTNFSINFWANLTNNCPNGNTLLGTGNTNANSFYIACDAANVNLLTFFSAGHAPSFSAANLLDSQWHMFTVVFVQGNNRMYLDGVNTVNDTISTTFNGNKFQVGGLDIGGAYINGIGIDELGIWNQTLTPDEVTTLYNSGLGYPYSNLGTTGVVTQLAPADNYTSANSNVTFNCSAQVTGGSTLTNISLYTNTTGSFILNQTNIVSTTFNETSFSLNLSDGTYSWACQACDSDNTCGFSENRTLVVGALSPLVTINSPTSVINYAYLGKNVTLNATINGTALDTCIFNYNSTNHTFPCATGQSSFILDTTQNLIVYANNTGGNMGQSSVAWNYLILENARSLNSTTFESAHEDFLVNVTANSSLTAANLVYNGTSYAMTDIGLGRFTKGLDLSSANMGNNSVYFSFNYGGSIINSTNSYQVVSPIQFGLCNSTLTVPYLNITFKDESTLGYIDASLPLAEFQYSVGSTGINKTLTMTNNTDNPTYVFCATPNNIPFTIDPYVQYKQGTSYPQRIWNPAPTVYTNATTNQILYLLSSTNGIYVTFQVINTANQAQSGVSVNATRSIDGNDVLVASGVTSSSGTVTFWLNPDFTHTVTFSKSGFADFILSEPLTQSQYTVTLGGGSQPQNSSMQGIDYTINPTNNYLNNDTTYNFQFTLTSSFWDVSNYGFNLRLANGSIVSTQSTTSTGTTLSDSYNVGNNSIIYMDYHWTINGQTTSATKYWNIQNTAYTQWSIANFFTDLNAYMATGLFGIDNFGRYLIVFLIIFIIAGTMSYKYGLMNPMAISTIIFGTVFFLDVVVGMVPPIRGISHMLTYVTSLVLVLSIIREMNR